NTKGKTYYKDQINNLLKEFKNSSQFPVTQKSTEKISSLIDWKWLLFLLVLLLSLEWFIRKYKGLI
ncbi:MAG: VWA domain-containing protein, partial [Ignavibacteriae bacterium]|nr:VWA domain-containing protein [Ignavibacteriota bacterium]